MFAYCSENPYQSKKRNNTKFRQRNTEANDLRKNLPLAVENRRSPLYCVTANVKTQFAVNFNLIISLCATNLGKSAQYKHTTRLLYN